MPSRNLSVLTSSYHAAVRTLFYYQFLARFTLPLLGSYLSLIINVSSRVISEPWFFLIINMDDVKGGL